METRSTEFENVGKLAVFEVIVVCVCCLCLDPTVFGNLIPQFPLVGINQTSHNNQTNVISISNLNFSLKF